MVHNCYMEFWQKLKKLRKLSGLSLEEVAQQLPSNVSRVAVGQWESSNENIRTEPRAAKRIELAQLYGLSVAELMSISDNTEYSKFGSLYGKQNTLKGTRDFGLIPIRELMQNGSQVTGGYTDMHHVAVSLPVGADSFATTVQGNSMHMDGADISFPHGSVILCEPSLVDQVEVGDCVIALLADDKEVFKLLDNIDGTPALIAINNRYTDVEYDFTITAVITQMIILHRLALKPSN